MTAKASPFSHDIDPETLRSMKEAFAERVLAKSDAAHAAAGAFAQEDIDSFYIILNREIGDGAFDRALRNLLDDGLMEPDLYHSMMWSVVESAACLGAKDAGGHAMVVTDLFAMPVCGSIEEVIEATGGLETIKRVASAMMSTGYVSEGTRVIISPTTIDPLSLTQLGSAVPRAMVEAFLPAFDKEYDVHMANALFEAVQGPLEFESIGNGRENHLTEKGEVCRFMIGATQRVIHVNAENASDAFMAHCMNETDDERLNEIAGNFMQEVNADPDIDVTFHMPLQLPRAPAFAALSNITAMLYDESHALGVQRTDKFYDEIVMTRVGESIAVEAIVGTSLLGPAVVPTQLFIRDPEWFFDHLQQLGDEFSERHAMMVSRTRGN